MFCNIDFKLIQKSKLFEREENELKHIVTVNAQFIVLANTNERFMKIVNNNYATFDGEVPLKFARMTREYKKAEAIKGSEIIYDFIDYAQQRDMSIFLLGGKESSNKKSVDIIRNKYGVSVQGYSPQYDEYPFSSVFCEVSIKNIREFCPDILFVGLGAPKQEYFIDDHKDIFKQLGIKYVIGCGGTFEFLSGNIKRAPKWVSEIGLEGFYRLFQEMTLVRMKRILFSFKFFKYLWKSPSFPRPIEIKINQQICKAILALKEKRIPRHKTKMIGLNKSFKRLY